MRSDRDLGVINQSQDVSNCKNTENDAGNA
jgi:hypothetical protein